MFYKQIYYKQREGHTDIERYGHRGPMWQVQFPKIGYLLLLLWELLTGLMTGTGVRYGNRWDGPVGTTRCSVALSHFQSLIRSSF